MVFGRRCLNRYLYCLAGLCGLLPILFFSFWIAEIIVQKYLIASQRHFKVQIIVKHPEYHNLFKPSPDYCHQLNFLVVVHVRHNDVKTRDFWRTTYGNPQFLRKYRYRLLFPIGLGSGIRDRQKVLHSLEEEQSWHGDLLLSDFDDTYKNISLKQLSHLQYFTDHCSPSTILVKIDDDVGWRVDKVARLVRDLKTKTTPETATIWCLLWHGMIIQRNPRSKWYVPETLVQGDRYPDYCSGIAYLASWNAANRLVHHAKNASYFWIDDVYITGTLATAANVNRENIGQNNYRLARDSVAALEDGSTTFQLGLRFRRTEMFHRVLNGIRRGEQEEMA